ncbi:polyphenol oxidase [Musa troglodytarum]|uniref:Polyphenol oxidase n=1 Tax=Musa troglodytarum TaxID=320322 RepID=A0A9E7GF85_9LILI|nr:polyphenol oxidase [Musa troglodytarum]
MVSISGSKHRHHVSPISCSTRDHNQPPVDPTVNRRHVLVGLGSLYGASAALTSLREASAAPIAAPDLSACGPADLPPDATPTNCCPPSAGDATEFVIPDPSSPSRVRPAAHSVDKDYIAKFAQGIALVKALRADDPRSFTQQANVHCAYCDGAYSQLQVHNSWLFLPRHRCYLYFFERILGKLIGDNSFAIPFWNWDAPDGMRLPAMYVDPTSPLYDPRRGARHQPPTLVDLDFGGIDPSFSDKLQIDHSLKVMYRQVVSNAPTPRLFFGNPYRAGDDPNPGGGSLENVPHGPADSRTWRTWATCTPPLATPSSSPTTPTSTASGTCGRASVAGARTWPTPTGSTPPSSSTTRTPTLSRSEFATASTPTGYATSTRTSVTHGSTHARR